MNCFLGCVQLSCPIGPPGGPGVVGTDGRDGKPGYVGAPGEDGYDIELRPEPDLPCIICPSGPLGIR